MTERDDIVEWTKGQIATDSVDKYVSIYTQGRLGIPKSVYRELLDAPENILLKFARDTQEIGIEPTHPDDPDGYMIHDDNRYVTCRTFLETFDLDTDEVVRHPISAKGEDSIWIDTTTVVE